MEMKTLLVLEDESAMNDVVIELINQGVPVRRFGNTPLSDINPRAEDPEVALYAREKDMVVFTADTSNPTFTDVVHKNNKDLRPPDVTIDKSSAQPKVEITTNSIPNGIVETQKVDPNKHMMKPSDKGHHGVIRMYQQDYMRVSNSEENIAKKTKNCLLKNGNSVHNQIKNIRV